MRETCRGLADITHLKVDRRSDFSLALCLEEGKVCASFAQRRNSVEADSDTSPAYFVPMLTCLKSSHRFKALGCQARRAQEKKTMWLAEKDFKAEGRIS